MKKPKKMPTTIYVEREHDGTLLLWSSLREVLSASVDDDDGKTVGIYELKDTKKLSVKKSLVP